MSNIGKRSFPSLLRAFRESRMKSTLELARELNITEDMVKRVEAGAIDIPEYLYGQWARFLGLKPEGLLWMYLQFKARSISLKSSIPAMFDIRMLTSADEMKEYIQKIGHVLQEVPEEQEGFDRPSFRINEVRNEYRFIHNRTNESNDGSQDIYSPAES